MTIVGTIVLAIGAVIVATMLLLTIIVIALYVEWDNAADALATVAIIVIPPIFAGLLLVWFGRLLRNASRHDGHQAPPA